MFAHAPGSFLRSTPGLPLLRQVDFFIEAGLQVGVNQGRLGVAMSEPLANLEEAHARLHQSGSESMPEQMQSELFLQVWAATERADS